MRKLSIVAISLFAVICVAGALVVFTEFWPYSRLFPKDEIVKEPDFIRRHIDSIASLHREFPTDADVVFVGDSRVQIPQWPDMFPNASVANRGIGSDTLDGLLKRVDNLGIHDPNVVVIEMGVNDVLRRHQTEFSAAVADQVMSRLRPVAGRMVVLEIIDCAVEGCDREKVSALNVKLKSLSEKYNAQFVSLNPRFAGPDGLLPEYSYDGLHLNAAGYRLLSSILCGEIDELACGGKDLMSPVHSLTTSR